MERGNNDFAEVQHAIDLYSSGLYTANVMQLRAVFHPQAMLQAPGLRLTRDEWLGRVASRPVPHAVNSSDDFQIRMLDIEGSAAMVKLYCPLFEHHYADFLTLLNEDGRWLIVNKTYADRLCQ